ncbi:esterase family protein [Robertkochia sp. 1368]|nr:esterase family protein [Robertkochia sediminum]
MYLLPFAIEAQEPAQQPVFEVAAGTIIHYNEFPSLHVPARNIEVWLPPGYNPERRYPVLYMHDGQMLFDAQKTWNKQEWGVDEVISSMIADESIPPVIVVGIWNISENRHSEYFPQKPFESLDPEAQDSLVNKVRRNEQTDLFIKTPYSDQYLQFITKELKPFIDKTYPTLSQREHTFIAGSSMGGLISMYAICEYPETFGGAACLSTHWPGVFQLDNNPIPQAFLDYLKIQLPDPETHKLYFDHGTATLDALYGDIQVKVNAIITAGGYNDQNFKTLVFPGEDHSENAWNKRLGQPLMFLLR